VKICLRNHIVCVQYTGVDNVLSIDNVMLSNPDTHFLSTA
jgi:hypothetical protein